MGGGGACFPPLPLHRGGPLHWRMRSAGPGNTSSPPPPTPDCLLKVLRVDEHTSKQHGSGPARSGPARVLGSIHTSAQMFGNCLLPAGNTLPPLPLLPPGPARLCTPSRGVPMGRTHYGPSKSGGRAGETGVARVAIIT